MNINDFALLFKLKKQTIVSVVIVFVLLALVLTFVQPFRYGAQTKLLVVQNTQPGIDPYQVNKANEYVSDVLADVVVTNSFFSEVMNAGYSIDANYFSIDPHDQLKEWKKTISANSTGRGIIAISVYHKDRNQADQIIRAVNTTLKSKNTLYHGLGDQVSVRIVNQPFVSNFPVKPNVILNLVWAVMFGLIFSSVYIYLFPEKHYDLRLLPRRKTRMQKINKTNIDKSVGVDKNIDYDVREAISKLRQREKNETDNFARRQGNIPENLPREESEDDYNDIIKQGDMGNVF